MEWEKTHHKQRRYDLQMSSCGKFFKKSSTNPKRHSPLEMELECLTRASELNLSMIQEIVSGNIDRSGESYIITKFCGYNITKNKVPPDWRFQLNILQQQITKLQDVKEVYHNDIQVRNLFVDINSQLTLIDFDLGSIGKPSKRAQRHPDLNSCDRVLNKIVNGWKIK